MRNIVRLPGRDALAQEFEFKAAFALFRNLDRKLVQLPTRIGKRFGLAENIGRTVDRDAE